MSEELEQSSIWQRTLAVQEGDTENNDKARELLRSALLGMRENARNLVTMIPEDCRGITVHDITHLDALWTMADLIAGPVFDLNPVEAFVFGASALIHDAGMTFAAYPGGSDKVRSTLEWQNAAFESLRRVLDRDPTDEEIWNPPANLLSEINFIALRALHAKHAEELISIKWKTPTGEELRLLESNKLLHAYGESIGRIAHSHHWNRDRLTSDLRQNVGSLPAPGFPPEWTLNETKVACLLRCADAAHIDARRAPSLLFALQKPRGVSVLHWTFQNRLNQVVKKDGALVYSSGSSFPYSEARAWWLCYDAIAVINAELQGCDAILRDIGASAFEVSRVYGANSPVLLARQVAVTGWSPVDAQISVSDPIQLAVTLGAKNLYGQGSVPPCREILQNAIDAVRARRQLENRPKNWGSVQFTLEQSDDGVWVHVDDSGIGMSERVLTGPLLDFGRSFWSSSLFQEEYPDLDGARFRAIGKFGIGFFAVFLLGQQVRVVSRKFTDGPADACALEFTSIGERPVVRKAKPLEVPPDYVTRVSVKLNDAVLAGVIARRGTSARQKWTFHDVVAKDLPLLTAAVDVDIKYIDKIKGVEIFHSAEWLTSDPVQFLRALLSDYDGRGTGYVERHAGLLSVVQDDAGRIFGRAALLGYATNREFRGDYNSSAKHVSVGGFVSKAECDFGYVGVLNGETDDVSRKTARVAVPAEVLARWATKQGVLLKREEFSIAQLMDVCRTIVSLGGDSKDLPFCYAGGRIVSKDEFDKLATRSSVLLFPLDSFHNESNFVLVAIEKLSARYFSERVPAEFVCLERHNDYGRVLKEDSYHDVIARDEDIVVAQDESNGWDWLDFLRDVWNCPIECVIRKIQLLPQDQYQPQWVIMVAKKD